MYMKWTVSSNVEFARQTNTDAKSLQCCFQWVQSNSTIHGNKSVQCLVCTTNQHWHQISSMLASMLYLYMLHNKEKCPMLSLHDKPTLTSNILNAGFNALLIYQNMLHEKEKCPMLSLQTNQHWHQISSMLGFNALLIYQNMLQVKEKCPMLSLHNKPTLTPNLFNAGFNALLIYQNMLHEKKSAQCWVCTTN